MKKLDIPHQNQNENNTLRDCGAFCVGMVANVPGDDVLAAIDHPHNAALHFHDLYEALRKYRLSYRHAIMQPDAMRREIDNGHPLILLVGLSPNHDYDGNHFIVVSGYDSDGFFIHDPLGYEAHEHVSNGRFQIAVNSAHAAMPGQCIVIQERYPFLEHDTPEPALAERLLMAQATIQQQRRIISALTETIRSGLETEAQQTGAVIDGKSQAGREVHNAVFYGEQDRYELEFLYTIPHRYYLHVSGIPVRVSRDDWQRHEPGDVWQ
jgi:hypothetical protein